MKKAGSVDETLDQFLNAYWLRPETALWRYIDVLAMSDVTLEFHPG